MYNYTTERHVLFTDEGQKLFLKIRDNTNRLLNEAGAVRLQEAIHGNSGDGWHMLACMDRLIELNEIKELTNRLVAAQHRVFIRA